MSGNTALGPQDERERALREAREFGFRQIRDRVGRFDVSTVRLPFPHPGPNDTECMYETMVFKDDHEVEQRRFVTCQQAVDGHIEAVERWAKVRRLVPGEVTLS